jgi:protocatechuate 4,5-dioxygenase, beta chain
MWLIVCGAVSDVARDATADLAGGATPKVAHRIFHVPASNRAVGRLILENS